jgi:hypothetical protein
MKHPAGIQPEGNLFLSGADNNCRDSGRFDRQPRSTWLELITCYLCDLTRMLMQTTGLGSLAILSDALLLEVLGYLGARDLCQLSRSSRALYAFCDHEVCMPQHLNNQACTIHMLQVLQHKQMKAHTGACNLPSCMHVCCGLCRNCGRR